MPWWINRSLAFTSLGSKGPESSFFRLPAVAPLCPLLGKKQHRALEPSLCKLTSRAVKLAPEPTFAVWVQDADAWWWNLQLARSRLDGRWDSWFRSWRSPRVLWCTSRGRDDPRAFSSQWAQCLALEMPWLWFLWVQVGWFWMEVSSLWSQWLLQDE